MKKTHNYHSDFDQLSEQYAFLNTATLEDFAELNVDLRKAWAANDSDEEVKVTKTQIKSSDGYLCDIQIIEPVGLKTPAPCLLFYHAGGFLITGMAHHIDLIREYALKVQCKVIYIDYRLIPEHPFPAASNDCYALLEWAYENSEKLEIDPKRIAIGGDSAGGCMTAVVAQMARDKNGPALAGQMMIFPTTDAAMSTKSAQEFVDTPIWNSNLSKMMWPLYSKNGDFGTPQYLSPMQAESFENLPKAYMETAEFDCLRDEGIAYAQALKNAGVPTILNETKRTVHCYDAEPNSSITKENIAKRIDFLKSILYN
ncbi:alpha/beta hydrolase [Enterococcus sp. LJL128]|uniref:alpha/beta hydrolase n=1 Tax=Enterococcus sp. LJL51 TaxID=3416656 RepID=UPI003CF88D14